MPYKDKEKQKTKQKEWVRQKRSRGSTEKIPFGTPGYNTVSDDGKWGCTTDGQKYRRNMDKNGALA